MAQRRDIQFFSLVIRCWKCLTWIHYSSHFTDFLSLRLCCGVKGLKISSTVIIYDCTTFFLQFKSESFVAFGLLLFSFFKELGRLFTLFPLVSTWSRCFIFAGMLGPSSAVVWICRTTMKNILDTFFDTIYTYICFVLFTDQYEAQGVWCDVDVLWWHVLIHHRCYPSVWWARWC